jgi:peptide/nickel transport system permease protein
MDNPMSSASVRVAPLLRTRAARFGFGIVLFFVIVAVAAPALAPHDPAAVNATQRLQSPSLTHPLGTDELGRDVLSRLLHGSRWSLATVMVATSLIMLLGLTLGLIAGYAGGIIDAVLMRLVDILLAVPNLLAAIAIAGTLGPGLESVMIALIAVWWAPYARLVRGMVMALRERPWIEAARALGARDRHIIVRHVVRNVLPPVLVLATVEMGELILASAGLNFLGLGAQPPTPEWGAMLNDGRPFLFTAPRLMIFPGVAITTLVIGFTLVGDSVRDALDPRTREATIVS